MSMTLYWHEDPGHAWLEVPKRLVERLEVSITPFSYVRNETAFLEEDVDAPAFLAAAQDANIPLRIMEACPMNEEHWIRYLNPWRA